MQKTILITGATDGIGLETARALVALGHRVLVHGRSAEKVARVSEMLGGAPGYVADLSDLGAVVRLAEEVLAQQDALDVVINNAGVFKTSEARTKAGLDVRFVVNTLAPYLLTQRLLPLLGKAGRVVNLSSAAQAPVDLRGLRGEMPLADMEAYAQSKLAITMWTQAMAERLPDGPVVVAVNPGSLLASKMVKDGFGVAGNDLGIGVDILVRAATAAEFADRSGAYFDNDSGRFALPQADAQDGGKVAAVVAAIEELVARG